MDSDLKNLLRAIDKVVASDHRLRARLLEEARELGRRMVVSATVPRDEVHCFGGMHLFS
jgi:hypothetical protein